MKVEEETLYFEESPETKFRVVSSKRRRGGKKVKIQRLPKNIKKSLKSKIHWTIIALLYEITEDDGEIEKHLNILKERLLKCIDTLEVPEDELIYLTNVQKELKQEEKNNILIKEDLKYLEEEITKACSAASTMDEKMQIVQKQIKEVEHELRTLETEASMLFDTDTKDKLGLPCLPMEYFKLPPLQNEVLKIGNPHVLLYEMNLIQQSDEMKNMMAFLEQLYEEAGHRCTEKQPVSLVPSIFQGNL